MSLKCTRRARGTWMAVATVLVLLSGSQACGVLAILDADGNDACPLWNPPGILIDVVDAGSESAVPHSANPAGFVVDGRVREPMDLVPPFPGAPTQLAGASGRAGVYDVEIAAEGYGTWRTSGISVEVDNCGHARTVEMTARLLPSTPTG